MYLIYIYIYIHTYVHIHAYIHWRMRAAVLEVGKLFSESPTLNSVCLDGTPLQPNDAMGGGNLAPL